MDPICNLGSQFDLAVSFHLLERSNLFMALALPWQPDLQGCLPWFAALVGILLYPTNRGAIHRHWANGLGSIPPTVSHSLQLHNAWTITTYDHLVVAFDDPCGGFPGAIRNGKKWLDMEGRLCCNRAVRRGYANVGIAPPWQRRISEPISGFIIKPGQSD